MTKVMIPIVGYPQATILQESRHQLPHDSRHLGTNVLLHHSFGAFVNQQLVTPTELGRHTVAMAVRDDMGAEVIGMRQFA